LVQRRRIVRHLELACSLDQQREYQCTAPPNVCVPFEIIEQWDDCSPKAARVSDVFSQDEIEAIHEFDEAWNAAVDATPNGFPHLVEVIDLPEWVRMVEKATSAVAVFAKRGVLPGEDEAFQSYS